MGIAYTYLQKRKIKIQKYSGVNNLTLKLRTSQANHQNQIQWKSSAFQLYNNVIYHRVQEIKL